MGKSITATTLFSSNILFWQEAGYFDAPSLMKQLLHTWSLAVEEQFYIFFPLVLLMIARSPKKRYVLWLAIIFILSLAGSIYGVIHQPGATFYLVPARAWELMAGSLLALQAIPAPSANWQRNLLSFTGIALITASIVIYTESTPFPGLSAVAPVLGASLVIVSGLDNTATSRSFAMQRLLSFRPLVFIGLISYSLYLWHWPLVAFTKFLRFRPFDALDSTTIIITSIIVSALSWKFVEQPFRGQQPLIPERKKLFAFSALIMLATIGTGALIDIRSGMSGRIERFYPEMTATIKEAMNYPYWQTCKDWEKLNNEISKQAKPPVVGHDGTKPSFALWGDSHAMALIPAIDAQAQQNRLSGYVLIHNGAPPLLDIERAEAEKFKSDHLSPGKWNRRVFEFIQHHPEIQTVLLTCRWGMYVTGERYKEETGGTISLKDLRQSLDGGLPNKYYVELGLKRTVDALLAMNRHVVLISDVPEIGYNVPRAYYISSRWPVLLEFDSIRPSRNEYCGRQKEANAILELLARKHGVTLIQPETFMFGANNGMACIMNDGKLLYRDDDHLSKSGALHIATVFNKLFETMGATKYEGKAN